MPRVLLWCHNDAREMILSAKQEIGQRWPGRTIEQLNPKYFRDEKDIVLDDDVVAVVVPVRYGTVLRAYQENEKTPKLLPLEWVERPAPVMAEGTKVGAEADSYVDQATVREIATLETEALRDVLSSIDSVVFLKALLKAESAEGRARPVAVGLIEARIDELSDEPISPAVVSPAPDEDAGGQAEVEVDPVAEPVEDAFGPLRGTLAWDALSPIEKRKITMLRKG